MQAPLNVSQSGVYGQSPRSLRGTGISGGSKNFLQNGMGLNICETMKWQNEALAARERSDLAGVGLRWE